VDGRRFDADPHPDPTFHSDADPDLNSDPTPSFTYFGEQKNCNFHLQKCQPHCVPGVIILSILDNLLQFSGKTMKYRFK
jgi:hypothetical protein